MSIKFLNTLWVLEKHTAQITSLVHTVVFYQPNIKDLNSRYDSCDPRNSSTCHNKQKKILEIKIMSGKIGVATSYGSESEKEREAKF